MADEFIKGLGIFVTAGLGWMAVAGWYRTPSFEGAQLTGPIPTEGLSVYDQIALFLGEAMFWFAIIGALTFWVLVPLFDEAREVWAERNE